MLNLLNVNFPAWTPLRNSILLVSMFLLSAGAMADRPDWAGQGDDGEHAHKHGRKQDNGGDSDNDERDGDRREYQHRDRDRSNGRIEIRIGGYFGESQRNETHEYYRERSRSGHCPPGLAKRHNGCMPPGQARKWAMGKALPRDIKYERIDPEIKIRLGMPPEGYKFVRVASDILLVAIGTGLVVDAIQDLGQ